VRTVTSLTMIWFVNIIEAAVEAQYHVEFSEMGIVIVMLLTLGLSWAIFQDIKEVIK